MKPTTRPFLDAHHALAAVAAGHCRRHSVPRTGGVACGPCWEQAIRDDERWAVENDLPRQLDRDPDLVDDVAVARAVAGEPVRLTRAERQVAINQLRRAGASPGRIAGVLRTNHTSVVEEYRRQLTAEIQTAGAA